MGQGEPAKQVLTSCGAKSVAAIRRLTCLAARFRAWASFDRTGRTGAKCAAPKRAKKTAPRGAVQIPSFADGPGRVIHCQRGNAEATRPEYGGPVTASVVHACGLGNAVYPLCCPTVKSAREHDLPSSVPFNPPPHAPASKRDPESAGVSSPWVESARHMHPLGRHQTHILRWSGMPTVG